MCRCALMYVGKTSKCLEQRIKQHLLAKLMQPNPDVQKKNSTSGITRHLSDHVECITPDLAPHFKVLVKVRHQCHIDVLEEIFIHAKSPERACSSPKTSLVTFAAASIGIWFVLQLLFSCYFCEIARRFCYIWFLVVYQCPSFFHYFLGCNSQRVLDKRPRVKMSCHTAVLLSVFYMFVSASNFFKYMCIYYIMYKYTYIWIDTDIQIHACICIHEHTFFGKRKPCICNFYLHI